MSGEKTEQPTSKKRRDSREKGQVAQSKDITMFMAIITVVGCIAGGYSVFLSTYQSVLSMVEKYAGQQIGLTDLGQIVAQFAQAIFILLAPVFLAAVTSLIVNLMQINGIVFSKEFLKFDLNKLNPVNNFKSIFSKKTFIKFLKQVFEIIVMVTTAFIYLRSNISDILKLSYLKVDIIIGFIALLILKLMVMLLGLYLVFAIVDWILEKVSLTKQLMMTKEEVKQEYKNSEGDPEIKHRRKELHRELLEEESLENSMRNSTLVVANPTHIAVVILYRPKQWALPVILLMAADADAQKIFKVARKIGIPVIRDKWIARSLFSYAEVGKFIPKTLVTHVAELIAKNLNLMPTVSKELIELRNAKLAKSDNVKI